MHEGVLKNRTVTKDIPFNYLRAHFLNFATLSQLLLVKIYHYALIRMIWRAVVIKRTIVCHGRLISRIAYIFIVFYRKLIMINHLNIVEVVSQHYIKNRNINAECSLLLFWETNNTKYTIRHLSLFLGLKCSKIENPL